MHDFGGKRSTTGDRNEQTAAAGPGPGKRTLAEMLPAASSGAPVQRKAAASAPTPAPARPTIYDLFGRGQRQTSAGSPLQRKAGAETGRSSAIGAVQQGQATPVGGGQEMPAAVRTKMEQAFGFDFSAVRLHEGPQAGAINALAYTQGTDIHMAPGQYRPHDPKGQALLGHELAHVVQQAHSRVSATAQAKGMGINDDPGLEREADEAGARAAAGLPAGIAGGGASTGAAPVVQRAVGFEFEMPEWRSYANPTDDQRLDKSTVIHSGEGFTLEADDQDKDLPASDVEVVIDPPHTQLNTLKAAVKNAADKVTDLKNNANEDGTKRIAHEGGWIAPQKTASPDVQATVAVPLKHVPALFEHANLTEIGEDERRRVKSKGIRGLNDSPRLAVNAVFETLKAHQSKTWLQDGDASPELTGLLVLIVHYLSRARLESPIKDWPKGLLSIMARTTFTKMFQLLPEHAFFSEKENADKFVALVCAAATTAVQTASERAVPIQPNDPVFPQTFKQVDRRERAEDEKDIGKATVSTTVEEWVRGMPQEDRLSFGYDHNYGGMGYLGGKTDRLIEEATDEAAVGGAKAIEQDIARLAMEEFDEQKPRDGRENGEPDEPDPVDDREKGKEIDRRKDDNDDREKGKEIDRRKDNNDESERESALAPEGARPYDREAPVFELRDVQTPGEPETWVDWAETLFLEVHRINQGQAFQGPTKPRDPSKPKPPEAVSGAFQPAGESASSGPGVRSVDLLGIREQDEDEDDLLGIREQAEDEEAGARPRRWWQKLCCFPFRCGCGD